MEWILAAAISVAGCPAPEEVSGALVVGRAQSFDSGAGDVEDVRYCEYFLRGEEGSARVLYYDPDGHKVAVKRLSLPTNSNADSALDIVRPAVKQEDFRHHEVREITRAGEYWHMRYRKNKRSRWQERMTAAVDVDVIDAGFDPFVRQRWEQLVSGKAIEFHFASPVHGQVVLLRARRVGCGSRVNDQWLCLEVDLARPWLRWLAGDLFLAYSPEDRRLRYFGGVVNLLDEQGASQKLSIRYFYP
ncbi:hypothetical protein PVT68_00965 [Microbulbifer bruguierae]|uniref:DUF3108 domain-containing protein n=1 Tax=Microbulbifer bruguierae TaxID=3029061 RepID=A0ABY8NER5_9GAMM|nr:hypothetical protein [Microbulbifer bruguierae]WGL16884.1 hypothetical protein PVT68_00965 [Microbulbifer bruguierae]